MAKSDSYLIFIEDHDSKMFAVSAPVSWRYVDDWLSKICALQEIGRSINGQDIEPNRKCDAVTHAKSRGYSEVSIDQLIAMPNDRSSDYIGSLPKYAQFSDRSKIVKILCKGKCGTGRLAELNKPYPGKDALRSAEVGEYRATCLKCGSTAFDNYNWHR
jgi:hypothetical protein